VPSLADWNSEALDFVLYLRVQILAPNALYHSKSPFLKIAIESSLLREVMSRFSIDPFNV